MDNEWNFFGEEDNKSNNRRRSASSSKKGVLLVLLAAAVAILAIAVFIVFQAVAESRKKPSGSGAKPTATPGMSNGGDNGELVIPTLPEATNKTVTAIVEAVDTGSETMRAYSIDDGRVLLLNYSSSSYMNDKYGKAIVAGQLNLGDLVKLTYIPGSGAVKELQVSADGWNYKNQTGMKVHTERNMITVGKRNYQFSDALHVYNDGKRIGLNDILDSDRISMRGIDSEVYIIEVSKGHGYLTFTEGKDYIGGSLIIDEDFYSQFTSGMSVTLNEGRYDIVLENGDLTAEMTVLIGRDRVTTVDLTPYARPAKPVGQVTFQLYPEGAVLWLNGERTYYGEPVELNYGYYEMRVESGGYETYTGAVRVEAATSTVTVSLTEVQEEDPETGYEDGFGDIGEGQSGNNGEDWQGTDPDNSDPNGETAEPSGGDSEDPNENDTEGGNGSDSTIDNPDNTTENSNSGSDVTVDAAHDMIIYSEEEVEIYLDGEFLGVIEDGKAVFDKRVGSFTLELVRGEERKGYQITIDDDGEDFIFKRYFD